MATMVASEDQDRSFTSERAMEGVRPEQEHSTAFVSVSFKVETETTPTITRDERFYHFSVSVREGEPGFADDDIYTSRGYKSFADAYHSLCDFNPVHRWENLRHVHCADIWHGNGESVNVVWGNRAIALGDLAKLNVTEADLDAAILQASGEPAEICGAH